MTDSTGQIEDDLKVTRARIDGRLTELREHLSPGQILDDVIAYLRDSGGGDFGRNLMTSVRSNPLPVTITGIGLAWLMLSGSGRPSDRNRTKSTATPSDVGDWSGKDLDLRLVDAELSVKRGTNETDDAWRDCLDIARGGVVGLAREAGETAESFRQRIAEAISQAKEAVARNVHGMEDRVAETGRRLTEAADRASYRLTGRQSVKEAGSDLVSAIGDNPLLLGTIALGFGAFLGTVIPQSEQEEEALAGIARKVRNTAHDVVDRGSEVAEHVLAAGKESARAHGFSGDMSVGELVDEVKSGELATKVEGVGRDTLQTAATETRKRENDFGQTGGT
jgi:hypothetical protein